MKLGKIAISALIITATTLTASTVSANTQYTSVGKYKVDLCLGNGVYGVGEEEKENETFNLCDKDTPKLYDKIAKSQVNFNQSKILGVLKSNDEGYKYFYFIALDPKTKTVNAFPYFVEFESNDISEKTIKKYFSKEKNKFCINVQSDDVRASVWLNSISAGGNSQSTQTNYCGLLTKDGFSDFYEFF